MPVWLIAKLLVVLWWTGTLVTIAALLGGIYVMVNHHKKPSYKICPNCHKEMGLRLDDCWCDDDN